MSDPSPRRRASRTGNAEVDRELEALLDTLGATANRDQLLDIFTTAVHLATDKTDRLDLKIASSALREMRAGFQVFAPHRHKPKVTMFGSARTLPTDPLYRQARDLAAVLAQHGWSTVTGAGPGIMAAGLEGAGPEHAFGINIELPFETEPNEFIASDPKLVSMKYFFTRKLLLIKESDGFAVLPGGFGTLDEEFELLTLLQTGKAAPAPIVLLEVPGGTYWRAWEDWIVNEVEPRNLINPDDRYFYKITDSVDEAAAEILGFYRNYHSLRFVGHTLVIRLKVLPTDDELTALSEEFSDITRGGMGQGGAGKGGAGEGGAGEGEGGAGEGRDGRGGDGQGGEGRAGQGGAGEGGAGQGGAGQGGIHALAGPLPAESRTEDHPELPRIALRFDRMSYARLRLLIDALNRLPSAPRMPAITGRAGRAEAGG